MTKLIHDYQGMREDTIKRPSPRSVRARKDWAMPKGNIKKQRKLRAMGVYVPNANPHITSI